MDLALSSPPVVCTYIAVIRLSKAAGKSEAQLFEALPSAGGSYK